MSDPIKTLTQGGQKRHPTNSLSLNLEFVPSSVSRTCKLIFSCSEGKQTQVVFITCFNG